MKQCRQHWCMDNFDDINVCNEIPMIYISTYLDRELERCLLLSSRHNILAAEVNEHLNRLRASEPTSTSSSSIRHKLNGFQDLYVCVNKLLQLPSFQQALAQDPHKEYIDELLVGSLRLLDLCSTAKDVVLQTKESVNELQSVLRRRKSGEFELVSEVSKYLTSKKVVKKTIHKALGNLKGMQANQFFFPTCHEAKAILRMLQEVEAVTSSMFDSLLSLISGPKPGSWSLVSKLLHHKRKTCEETGRDINGFEMLHAAVKSLAGQKMRKSEDIMNVEMQNHIKDLELCIQDLEDGLECVFRCIVTPRIGVATNAACLKTSLQACKALTKVL
ncbi:hypothetical protein DITRI_Ditri08aG0147000 [Diplodiscus trichospermus]